MPELPEVETVRRGLEKLIVGRRIERIRISYPPLVRTGLEALTANLTGATVQAMKRRGKYLLFDVGEQTLVSHLRMEGKWLLFTTADLPTNKHFHAFFDLDNGQSLVYQDVRKFGTLDLLATADLPTYFASKKLGPEPTPADFELEPFVTALQASKKKIKSYLLEQSLVVGLGNIYVDEVLWAAAVHPERIAASLTRVEAERLRAETIRILQLAVDLGGSTIRTYHNALGEDGRMQEEHQVYGKTGLPCSRCGIPIEKIKIGGRGSHFCPQCQKN